jgi:serine/threonine protein kinase
MSPEALKNNIYTAKSDIWSLGVMLYEMVHGKAPWESTSEKELLEKINKQNYQIGRNLSEDLKDFIRKCLASDELKRLSLAEFQNHPFILRITEGDGIPQLLRKPTSWNEPNTKECNTSKDGSSNHILENMTAEPSSLHHRKNPQSKPKTEKQFTSQINLMRYLYRLLEQLSLA